MSDISKDSTIGNPEHDESPSTRDQQLPDIEPPRPDEPNSEDADSETQRVPNLLSHLTGHEIDHYLVGSRIGGGAFSAVYQATDLRDGRLLALKVLLPGADDVTRHRFRQEARTAANLDHPHIVKTVEVGEKIVDNVAYIVMELVKGESLADLLERFHQLSVVDAAKVLEPIARALEYAHELAIVHRDVKPSNILLRPVAEPTTDSVQLSILDHPVVPLLSDFGIARALDSPELTSAGRTIGTPAYMAPEQCSGSSQVDGRADIYALGTVFYRCLVGRPPYIGTTTQILYAHVYNPLTIPDSILVNLPSYVITLLQRSLAKDVSGRYAKAGQMAEDLARSTGTVAEDSTSSGVDRDVSTVTMASLPAASEPPTDSQSSILIPTATSNLRPNPIVVPRREPTTTGSRMLRHSDTASTSGRPGAQKRRWVGLGIGLAIVIIMAVVGGVLLRRSLPTVAPAVTVLPEPTAISLPTETVAVAAANAGTNDDESTGRPSPTPPKEITIPAMPPITVPSAWDDAQFLYDERDWQEALDSLTLILRTDSVFNQILGRAEGNVAGLIASNFDARIQEPIWDRWSDVLDADKMAEMLFDIFVGLGTKENAANRHQNAIEFFDAALAMQPESEVAKQLQEATVSFVQAHPGDKPETRKELYMTHANLSGLLASQGQFCAAAEQEAAAMAINPVPEEKEQSRLLVYERRCAMEVDAAVAEAEGSVLGGHLLYSTQDDGTYRIYRVTAEFNPTPHLVVDNATQPALSPKGTYLAIYSTRSDLEGLAGYEMGVGLDPNERSVRYTPRFVEDAKESPPSWSPQSNRLVFASTREGDKRSRIYVTWADGEDNTTNITYGKDPAWHPQQDLIVFNGRDETGNNPGLWLTNVDGSGLRRLTTAEDDMRPVWTPDGQHVVFMNRSRSGNWDIYRVNLEDTVVTAITDSLSRDGLPTVSPDGRHIAFVSDRDGNLGIWIQPWLDGEPERLAPIFGQQNDWLEHSIQWTN